MISQTVNASISFENNTCHLEICPCEVLCYKILKVLSWCSTEGNNLTNKPVLYQGVPSEGGIKEVHFTFMFNYS